MPVRAVRTEKLDLRLSSADKRRLESAASAAGRSVSAFVLEGALSQADHLLADRQTSMLSKAKMVGVSAGTGYANSVSTSPRALVDGAGIL